MGLREINLNFRKNAPGKPKLQLKNCVCLSWFKKKTPTNFIMFILCVYVYVCLSIDIDTDIDIYR